MKKNILWVGIIEGFITDVSVRPVETSTKAYLITNFNLDGAQVSAFGELLAARLEKLEGCFARLLCSVSESSGYVNLGLIAVLAAEGADNPSDSKSKGVGKGKEA